MTRLEAREKSTFRRQTQQARWRCMIAFRKNIRTIKSKKICIKFDPIETDTLDRGKVVEPIDSVVIDDSDKLSKLKEELGKYYG